MRLPAISGAKAVRGLEKLGFRVLRQRGSHVILRRDDPPAQVVVPLHRTLDRGTLAAILRLAKVSRCEFVRALR